MLKVTEIFRLKSIFSVFVLCLSISAAITVLAQNNQTQNKADQNLKSSARVNPATLAMELSIPITNYPGRGGNSKPFILNYSSKVWNLKMFNLRTHNEPVSNQYYDNIIYQSTEIRPNFAERSSAGWTSSLQPAIILETSSSTTYNEFGDIYGGNVPAGVANLVGEVNEDYCHLIGPEMILSSACESGFAMRWHKQCCPPFDFCFLDDGGTVEECVTSQPFFFPGSGSGGPFPPSYVQQTPYKVKRVTVLTPDGVSHEFRKSDKAYNCNNEPAECYGNNSFDGTYLSVDGTGLRLVMNESQFGAVRDALYFPDGSKYLFTPYSQNGQPSTVPPKYIDADGNVSTYGSDRKWTDTMGREIQDPFNDPQFPAEHPIGTQDLAVKGLNNQPMSYSLAWNKLENVFEDEVNMRIKPVGADKCDAAQGDPVGAAHLFENQTPGSPDDRIINRTRFLAYYRTCAGRSYTTGQVVNFDPTVISEVNLPNGKKYVFKYNEYGEITKIIYPSGSYERFEYGYVDPIGYSALEVYQRGNRGVLKRYVSFNGTTDDQEWTYQQQSPTVTTIAPDGTKTERDVFEGYSSGFGFEDPRNGMVKEERTKDANGVLRSRTINDWVNTAPRNGGTGERDPRLKRSVTIVFEPNSSAALATLNETDYDDSGSTDPTFFPHLNVKRKKAYNYAVISNKTTVDNEALDWTTITGWFSGKLADVSETDYWYDSNYHARGFNGLPYETRALDPANQTTILSRTRLFYDNWMYSESGTAAKWEDPSSTLRGKVTITRSWLKDPITQTETDIDVLAQYDKFGNLRKAWDAAGNMTEMVYEDTSQKPYKFAYPTKVIAPAPDPNNTHGTNLTSSVETTYDFTTGLVLSVKDDYGQITNTEYIDPLLRPTRVYAENFTAPEAQSVYDDNAHTVKVRKQIDGQNWDEVTTYKDQAGRTILTKAKDSQGDVFVNTHYDLMGRVDCVTNPYRQGEAAYWNKKRFDEIGRAVESYAPAALSLCQTGGASLQSLGTASFDISTVSGYEGTVVISNDASGRKGRSITNALGQLLRVDEPTAFGGTAAADLGAIDTPHQPTFYTYSKLGKMVKVQQGKAGEPIQYRYFLYDNLGRLRRVKQPEQEGNTGLAFTDSISGNASWSAGFTYDVRGNMLTATNANGTLITNVYDNIGRVKTRSYSNEPPGITTPSVTYKYDGVGTGMPFAKGKITEVSNVISTSKTTSFDNMGRPLVWQQITDGQTYQSSYKYDLSGILTEETYPSGEVVRNFLRSDGNMSRVAVSGHTYVSDLDYAASGGVLSLRLGNGLWETSQFSPLEQVTQLGLGTASNNTNLWKVNFEYGEIQANGTTDTTKNTGNVAKQILTIPSANFVQSYKYDSLHRLTEAKEITNGSQNWIQNFNYDRFGNRNSFNQQIGSLTNNTTPTVDTSTNRFSANQGFSYDKNGNIIQDGQGSGTRSFVFNGDNKQVQVKDNNGLSIGTYYYDSEGARVKKINDFEKTIFVYDAFGKLIAEYSDQISQNPTVAYLTTDHLDSPRIVTNKNGTVISRRDFLPFGEELSAGTPNRSAADKYAVTGDSIRKKFTGYEKDAETGLDFAEARYYNNQHGRFTAIDPLFTSTNFAKPQGFNRFIYVRNNPLNLTDSLGLCPEEEKPCMTMTDKDGNDVEVPGYYYHGIWVYCTDGPCGNDHSMVNKLDLGIDEEWQGLRRLVDKFWKKNFDPGTLPIPTIPVPTSPGSPTQGDPAPPDSDVPTDAGGMTKEQVLALIARIGIIAFKAHLAQMNADRQMVPDDYYVVRGGVNPDLSLWKELSGSFGHDLRAAGRGIRNGQMWYTTAGQIRATGGRVWYKPEPIYPGSKVINYRHVGIILRFTQGGFQGPVDNPAPKSERPPSDPNR